MRSSDGSLNKDRSYPSRRFCGNGMLDWAGLLESEVEQHVRLQEAVVEYLNVQHVPWS